MSVEDHFCQGDGCNKPAALKCPTCLKMKLEDSYFCDQDCFKKNWGTHKATHIDPKAPYNPWPYYSFTGSVAKDQTVVCYYLVNGVESRNSITGWPDASLPRNSQYFLIKAKLRYVAMNNPFLGKLRPFRITPRRDVPAAIPRPDYALHPEGVSFEERQAKKNKEIKVLDDEEIEGLKVACKLGREVLNEAAKAISVGVTTDEIDRVVHEAAVERDCYPSPLGYYKFPKSCCTSVNEVICHGIPDMRKLENGDLCNVDVTVYHRGFHGDLNETFFVGKVDEESMKLTQVTHECLQKAIEIVRPGVKFREIGSVIQKHANANGFSVVKAYCGHGIHRLFHTAPNVPHYAKNTATGVMHAGNAFTIEPMINAGSYHDDRWPDDWTAVTQDGKRSAQFEHTLLVTENGCEILTQREGNRPWFLDQM